MFAHQDKALCKRVLCTPSSYASGADPIGDHRCTISKTVVLAVGASCKGGINVAAHVCTPELCTLNPLTICFLNLPPSPITLFIRSKYSP